MSACQIQTSNKRHFVTRRSNGQFKTPLPSVQRRGSWFSWFEARCFEKRGRSETMPGGVLRGEKKLDDDLKLCVDRFLDDIRKEVNECRRAIARSIRLLVARYWPAEIQLNDQLSTPTTQHVGDVCTLSTKREKLGW